MGVEFFILRVKDLIVKLMKKIVNFIFGEYLYVWLDEVIGFDWEEVILIFDLEGKFLIEGLK